MSTGYQKQTYTSVAGGEERTPEPKPRWNPRPEQIRILEAIFNSGMINPSRDEIRNIRVQLQEYGQVGDANVFYWFQNRKSRSKQKQRQLQNTKSQIQQKSSQPMITNMTAPSSSSSSSDKAYPNSTEKAFSVGSTRVSNSPTSSVNQPFYQAPSDLLADPFFFPAGPTDALPQGFCFPNVADQSLENCSSLLLGDFMLMNKGALKKAEDHEKIKLHQQLSHPVASPPTFTHTIVPPSFSFPSPINPIQGGPKKSTVFINDVCFEVAVEPLNVRETLGDNAMLIHSSGLPILTDEWGVTLQPLEDGAFYYLVHSYDSNVD
ncbi:WUSCHEL-related homeobox 8 [Abeliophyllum distichum]|uniref:Protein WUSCHEL n=1 Tax=Abeliophyllum distichum TaxID=126358 RepID=A0ABD1QGG3_9LAMI